MPARFTDDRRLCELMAKRAVEGRDAREQGELEARARRYPDFDDQAFERVAASLALDRLRSEPMPAALRARVAADAEAWCARVRGARGPGRDRP
jgi:hypothetical protein